MLHQVPYLNAEFDNTTHNLRVISAVGLVTHHFISITPLHVKKQRPTRVHDVILYCAPTLFALKYFSANQAIYFATARQMGALRLWLVLSWPPVEPLPLPGPAAEKNKIGIMC
jgi:hypothetical protein